MFGGCVSSQPPPSGATLSSLRAGFTIGKPEGTSTTIPRRMAIVVVSSCAACCSACASDFPWPRRLAFGFLSLSARRFGLISGDFQVIDIGENQDHNRHSERE